MKCRWPAGVSPADVTACTRCDRLNISCNVPENAPRKRRAKSTRVTQLEQKLDGIMSLLESNQRAKHRSGSAGSASTSGDAPSPLTPESTNNNNLNNPWPFRSRPSDCAGQNAEKTASLSEERPSPAVFVDRGVGEKVELMPGFSLTFTEANEYLNIYRKDYMPIFPFVIIEDTTKAHELYHNTPALFWMIMAAVSQTSEDVDTNVKKWLRQYVADTMIVKQEKTLELLQAILIHLIWGAFHFYIDAETPLFMNLAQNIVLDLKLDWPPEHGQVYKHSLLGAAWCHMNKTHLMRKRRAHTPAEIRAVLGLHYATTVTMSMFRRGPGLVWNNYLTKSCDSIAALCQHPLDVNLAAGVRLQRIAQKGLSALPGTEYVWGPSATVYSHSQEMTLNLTRVNMEKFVNSQTAEVQNDVMFRHMYLALLVRLYEPVLGMQPTVSFSDNSANATAHEPFRRTDMLWKLVEACKALFEARRSLPVAQTALRPSTMTGFLAFGVVTASRVLFHEAEDWDPAVARRYFDYGALLLECAAQFEKAEEWARAHGRRRQMQNQEPLFTLYAHKLRWIQQWYVARGEADAAAAAQGSSSSSGSMGRTPASNLTPMTESTLAALTPAENTPGQSMAGDASMVGMDEMGTDQQTLPSFLSDFQFDEAFWQDMLLGTPQQGFGQYSMGNTI
ncbi:hypothetical protein PWT90_09919 [Aphanocladium album]|nr:hypothetical protein PWT90_09919 [Aphanocladium album]